MDIFDCLGHKVDHLITMDEFQKDWLYYWICNCHSFSHSGFLFNEGGAWGLDDCPVGFKTKNDLKRYQKWLRLNPMRGKSYPALIHHPEVQYKNV